MGLLKLIKEEIGYLIYYALPYADLDIFGILAGTTPFQEVFSFLEHLPFVNGINFWKLSTLQKIIFIPLMLVPYVDLELLKLGRIHKWFIRSRSKKIRIATKEGTKQAQKIQKYVSTANAFGISTKEIRETLEHALSDLAEHKREHLIHEALVEAGKESAKDYSDSRGVSRGRAMTDGGQPSNGANRRNPSQGGNGLQGYSDIRVDNSGRDWKAYLRKGGIAALGIGIIAVVAFVALQISGAVLGIGTGVAGAGSSMIIGALGFIANPIVIGTLVLPIAIILIFKYGGASAGKGFLILAGILLVAGGLGSVAVGGNPLAYIGYGEQVADSQAGLVFGEAEGAARVYGQAKARVFCLLKGPACLRQWQLNNTQRPGSEDVGETYGLKIDGFQVGQGEQLDIAYKDSDSAIPVSFTISNPRHGLKGIEALDVSYRLRIIDSDRDQANPYCDTGWINIQEAYDIDGDDSKNDIYPGTSASTGFLTLNDEYMTNNSEHIESAVEDREPEPLTLESCEMLQPALGQNRVALLNLKYDYFSQATLDFEAMSRDYFQSNEDIEKTIKESKTADTPVKAAINVNSPVLFTENGQGERDPRPFAARATLNTDKNDIEYEVHDFSVRNSRYLTKSGGGNCQFDNVGPGQEMVLDEDSRHNIISGSDDARDASYYWFDTESNPPIFGCVMQLDDESQDNRINEISPSGETLTMRIRTNYTVSKRERLGSLNIYNSICSRVDCPLIVTTQANESEPYDFRTICEGLDAGNGCSIVEPSYSGWENVGGDNSILNRNSPDGDGGDTNIERGEIAVQVEYNGQYDNNLDTGMYYGGLEKREFEQIASSVNSGKFSSSNEEYTGEKLGIVHYTDNEGLQEMEIVELDETDEGGCEYQSRYADSGLIWKSCNFNPSQDEGEEEDRFSYMDVLRLMGPIMPAY